MTTVAMIGEEALVAPHIAAARVNGMRVVEPGAPADVVVVASPLGRRAADAIAALRAGAAVLVETPMCRTLAEADAMVAAAGEHGERLLYGEHLAYAPIVEQLVARCATLGPARHIEVRVIEHAPAGVGALFELGSHPLAVALLAANAGGAGRAVGVSAVLRAGEQHDVDEHADVQVHFAGGLIAHVVASRQASAQPLWDAQVASEVGVVRAELLPAPLLEHNGDEVRQPPSRPAVEHFGYSGQLAALVSDVAAGRPPATTAAFGRHVLQMVAGAYTSAAQGGALVALPFAGARDVPPYQLWSPA